MRIHIYAPEVAARLLHRFEELRLLYGPATRYSSLLSPSSAYLTAAELRELQADIGALASLYRTGTALYLASCKGEAPPWLRSAAEYGLTPRQVEAHRMVTEAGLEPLLARVDYVEVADDRRQVAEVQWKSGGPGFFYGHCVAYEDVCPLERGIERIGDLVSGYIDILSAARPEPGVIVNESRTPWLVSEALLAEAASSRGLVYLPLDRAGLTEHLYLSDKQLCVRGITDTVPVGVLRGRGFTDVLDDAAILQLAVGSIERQLWVEIPLNFLYRQKWVLALPFCPGFQCLFEDRLRSILIPTVLVMGKHLDLSPLANAAPAEQRERLSSVASLRDLLQLPESYRSRLVLKCGAGVGRFHNGGYGVFRLSGARSSAAKILDLIEARAVDAGEPWIIQPYVDRCYDVPLALPFNNSETQLVRSHARIMVFGGRRQARWNLHGAIANFSGTWKVTGAPARSEGGGQLLGSAFTDVRVQSEPPSQLVEFPGRPPGEHASESNVAGYLVQSQEAEKVDRRGGELQAPLEGIGSY